MERPDVTDRTVFIGVDGGYSNLGMVAFRMLPSPQVLVSVACRRKNRGHDSTSMRAHCREMSDHVVNMGESFGWRNLVWAYEDWKGGKNVNTVRWRSDFDGRTLNTLENQAQPILIVAPHIHKQVLNPLGRATDDGRKTELSYLHRLNSLDTIFTGACLDKIANPQFLGDVGKKWKDACQHSLDAAAVGVSGALACLYDYRTGGVQGYPQLPAGQLKAAEYVAQAAGID